MTSFSLILEREFQRFSRASGNEEPGRFRGLRRQSEFLGVALSWLSRLRNGKVELTEQFASRLAEKFYPDPAAADRRKLLIEELLGRDGSSQDMAGSVVESVVPGDVSEVISFFRRLGRDNAFLAVEYRDFPRTAGTHPRYPRYAAAAGKAISEGLTFCMFQPFGGLADATPKRNYYQTKDIRRYFEDLRDRVRETQLTLLYEALKARGVQKRRALKPSEELELSSRVVLYERGSSVAFATDTGVSSRLFYVVVPEGDCNACEVWDWIATDSRDYFLSRDPETLPPHVVAQQFFPVTTLWEKEKKIPLADNQLAENVRRFNRAFDANLPEDVWRVYRTPSEALKECKEHPFFSMP